jgi:hypothetical protein
MHYPNLMFHGVEAIRLGFNTAFRRVRRSRCCCETLGEDHIHDA